MWIKFEKWYADKKDKYPKGIEWLEKLSIGIIVFMLGLIGTLLTDKDSRLVLYSDFKRWIKLLFTAKTEIYILPYLIGMIFIVAWIIRRVIISITVSKSKTVFAKPDPIKEQVKKYTTDSFMGVQWIWQIDIDKMKISPPIPYCPKCKMELVVQGHPLKGKCDTCRNFYNFGESFYDHHSLANRVYREINRIILNKYVGKGDSSKYKFTH